MAQGFAWKGSADAEVLIFGAGKPGRSIAQASSGGETISTSSGTALNYGGTDGFTLASARPIFTWEDGSLGVVSDGDVVISGDSPTSGGSPEENGMMLRSEIEHIESVVGNAGSQGLEQYADTSQYKAPWDASLNKAPSHTSSNLTVATSGNSGGVVKSKQVSSPSVTSILEKLMVLTVVPSAPLVGSIRPPMWGGSSSVVNINDFDFNRVRSFTMPSPLPLTLANALAYMQVPQCVFIDEGEPRRTMCYGEDYARDIVRNYIAPAALYMLDPNVSGANRTALARAFAVRATDAYGAVQAGRLDRGGAGQCMADHFCLALVAALTNSSALITASRAMYSNLNDQCFWVTSDMVGQDVAPFQDFDSTSSNDRNIQPILSEHVGYGLWQSDSWHEDTSAVDRDSLWQARYMYQSGSGTFGAIGILGMVEGGWEAIWGPRATWDTDNDQYATLQQHDKLRVAANTPLEDAGNSIDEIYLDLWDDERATMPEGDTAEPISAFPPIQINFDIISAGILTETASGANVAYGSFTGSALAITERQMRLSHDGIQFTSPITVSATDTLAFTGTMYVQERRQNSEGWSPWCINYPSISHVTAPDLRNIVTGGTIPTAAPTNSTAPQIYIFAFSEEIEFWAYTAASGTLGDDKGVLIAGAGIYTNGIDHSATSYQWQVDVNGGGFSNIGGATSQKFSSVVSYYSDVSNTRKLRCNVTVDDGNGNTTTTATNELTMPIPAPAYDDDFSTDTSANYTIAGATVTSGSKAYDAGNEQLDVTVTGSFIGVSSPAITVLDSVQYDITVNVTNNGSAQMDLTAGDTLGSDDAESVGRVNGGNTGNLTLTVTASGTSLYVTPRFRGGVTGQSFSVNSILVELA